MYLISVDCISKTSHVHHVSCGGHILQNTALFDNGFIIVAVYQRQL